MTGLVTMADYSERFACLLTIVNESEGSLYWRLYAAWSARHAITDYSERCHHFPCPAGFAARQSIAQRVAFTEYSERWVTMVLLITVNISITQLSSRKPFNVMHVLITVNVWGGVPLISVNRLWRFQLRPFDGKDRFTDYSERSYQSTNKLCWLQWTLCSGS